ncbi:hypothetical protein GCM10027184_56590 [Saccharothrix stipae]
MGLPGADGAEIGAVRAQAPFTGGGDDQHHAVSLPREARHRAAGQQGFVIGVGVEENARSAHECKSVS